MPTDLYSDRDRLPVLIVGSPADRGLAIPAVEAAGGRIMQAVDWRDLPEDAAVRLVVAAVGDIDEEVLGQALDRLGHLITAADCRVVVMLHDRQIDGVASALLGSGAELLCDPDLAGLAAAVAVALTQRADMLADTVREGEDERLRRLNEEVARIARLLTELSEGEQRSGGVSDRVSGYGPPPVVIGMQVTRAADIRNAIRARRMRDQHFAAGLFEDPAWDMLLDLYAAEMEGARVSVSSLCIAAAVAPTTALRWITRMTDSGLFERRPDPFDRRRVFLGLSADARGRMDRYFAALATAGLPTG